jgi:hypothetical protein
MIADTKEWASHLLRAAVPVAVLLAAGSIAAQTEDPSADRSARQTALLVPPSPQDPAAAKAYAVLDQHCARCHQTGKLKHPRPAGNFANVLDLAALARNSALVRPGTPDASRLYTLMVAREMPYDTSHDQGGEEPTPEEIQVVRDWIQELPAGADAGCRERARLEPGAIDAAIAKSLEGQPEGRRKDARFVTMTHLYNACVPDATLEAYRQAVARMLNSLSWSPAVLKPEPVDEHKTVLRLELSALGWVAGHWDQLVQAYPYAALPAARASASVQEATGTGVPALRADWLAAVALKPPHYNSLLGLPGRHADLQRVLGFDAEAGVRAGIARRAGFRDSRIVRGNRLVERHQSKSGSVWISYDFAGSTGRQSIFDHPFGPNAGIGGRQPFRPDGLRTIFSLPNGFFGFAQHDSRGDSADASPPGLDREPGKWAGTSGAGAGCMGCHALGPIRARDEVRAAAEADRTYVKEVRDALLATHPPGSELEKLVEEDARRYRAALEAAGIDPALMVGGLDPVSALIREHTGPADLGRVAAEVGIEEADLRSRLAAVGGEARIAALRLRQGVAARAEVDRLLASLAPEAAPKPAQEAGPTEAKSEERRAPGLLVWSDREAYKSGEIVVFHARTDTDCNLTLISIDKSGKAIVLLPNEFEQSNHLVAGKELKVPGEGAPYQFRLKEKGRETLVGVCTVLAKTADGIQQDYERQRFTVLGNWRNHLTQALAEDAGERRHQAEGKQPEQKARAKRRGRGKTAESKPETAKAREQQARTAITIDID